MGRGEFHDPEELLLGSLGGYTLGRPRDLEGRPVKRTKACHPYSYDGFVVVRKRPNAARMECAYTDRMWSWDTDRMKQLTQKHLGRYQWSNCPADRIEEFLREWAEDPGLQFIALMEWCNWASGYPVWSLHWVYSKEKQELLEEEARTRALARGCLECQQKFDDTHTPVLVGAFYYCPGCAPTENHEQP